MTYSRNDRSFDRLFVSDRVVRLSPAKTCVSISRAFSFPSSVSVFSEVLSGCRLPAGSRERALPERSRVSTLAPWNVPSRRTLSVLSCSSSFIRRSPSNAESGNSSMKFDPMLRRFRFVRPRNAPDSTVLILFADIVSVSRAGRLSKAPGPRLVSWLSSISSMRSTGSSGNVCVADNSTMSFFLNIILTVSLGKPNGISTKCWRSQ